MAKVTTPTIFAVCIFNAKSDAEKLNTALTGFICDRNSVIEIVCNRNGDQRSEIADTYKHTYGEDLKKRLVRQMPVNLQKLLVALVTPNDDYLAEQLHNAMKGLGTDEPVLMEILITTSNAKMHAVNRRYHALYGNTLESDIKGDTSGTFRKLCISLSRGNRDEDVDVDMNLASYDAKQLKKAGTGRWGTDESTFNNIFVGKSFEHLRKVFEEYEKIAGHTMEEAVKNEFSGNIKAALLTIVKFTKNRNAYFSESLRKAMKKSDNNKLIRILVNRSEIDLADIKVRYRQQYGETLGNCIRKVTSGKYRDALLTLIN